MQDKEIKFTGVKDYVEATNKMGVCYAGSSNITDKVKIGNITYKVEESKLNLSEDILGQIRFRDCTILLEQDLSPQMKRQTLIHEIVHGVLHFMGEYEDCKNEPYVDLLAGCIINLFLDNPKLLEVLKDEA